MGRWYQGEDTKVCSKCKEVKPLDEFNRSAKSRSGRYPSCRVCHREELKGYRKRVATTDWYRKKNLKQKYGLSVEGYDALLHSQGGACAICTRTESIERALAVDHDHSCCPGVTSCGKCVRGLLCFGCNSALGKLNDDITLLEAAVGYLRRHADPTPP